MDKQVHKNISKRLLFSLILCLCLIDLLAAQPSAARFQRLSTDDGLSQNSGLSLLQDHQGFLWIGTQDGLNRYDGHFFKSYRHDSRDSTTIANDYIHAILEDRKNQLWMGTDGAGLSRLDRATNTFSSYNFSEIKLPQKPDTDSLSANVVFEVREDQDGFLWLGTAIGVLRFDPNTGAFQRIRMHTADTLAVPVRALRFDREGMLWIGNHEGIVLRTNPAQVRVYPDLSNETDVVLRSDEVIRDIFQDTSGNIWIATGGDGLYAINPSTMDRQRYAPVPGDPFSLSESRVNVIYEDGSGFLWIGTQDGGLNRFDPDSGRFARFRQNPNDRYSLSDNYVLSIVEDRTGTLWVGTWDGINGTSPLRDAIRVHTPHADEPKTMNRSEVFSIYEDDTRQVWLGTKSGGLNQLDRLTESVTVHVHKPGDASTLAQNNVFSIREDRAGNLWLATEGGGLNVFNRSTGRFFAYRHNPNDVTSLSNDYVYSIHLDMFTNSVWIGTGYTGLNQLDRSTGRFTRFYSDSLNADLVWPIIEDHTGLLWVGTIGKGLFSFDRSTGVFTPYQHHPDSVGSLSGNEVYSLFEDKDHTLWVGTTEGLNRFDRKTGTFKVYRAEPDGLGHDHVTAILQDDEGLLWISTNNGLSVFDPQTDTFKKTYYVRDGLQNNRFYVGSAFKNDRGELFFGGPSGFNIIDPTKIVKNDRPPNLVLTGFRIKNDDHDVVPDPTSLKELTLDYDDNFFTLTFAALDFTNVEQNRYRYILEGLESDWSPLSNNNQAIYTSVPPDDYVFRVQAYNNDRVASNELSIPISITPPYYATWWFRTLVGLSVIGILFGLYHYRTEQLLQVERLRTRIARRLHDDIGANLSAITLKSQMIGEQKQDRLATEDVKRIEDITRLAKESTLQIQETVWVVNTGYDSLDKLVSKMEDLTATMLDGIAYTFKTPTPVQAQSITMDFRQNVYFLYKEALHNIVKHADADTVTIHLQSTAKQLTLDIQDNGRGFDPAGVNSGNGLNLMQKRASQIKGGLDISSKPGAGTRIRLQAPVG